MGTIVQLRPLLVRQAVFSGLPGERFANLFPGSLSETSRSRSRLESRFSRRSHRDFRYALSGSFRRTAYTFIVIDVLAKIENLSGKSKYCFVFMHLVCGDVPLGGMSRRVFSGCLIPDFRNRNRMDLDCMCLFVRRLRLMLLCRLCENPLQKLCRMLLWKGLLQLSVLPSRSLRFEFSEPARMLGGARHPSMRLSHVINCKPCAEFSFGREAPDV